MRRLALRGCSVAARDLLASVGGAVGGDTSLVGLDIHDLGVTCRVSLVGSLVSEDLVALEQSPLCVLAPIDEIGVVEGELDRAVSQVVRSLDTEHEGAIKRLAL